MSHRPWGTDGLTSDMYGVGRTDSLGGEELWHLLHMPYMKANFR